MSEFKDVMFHWVVCFYENGHRIGGPFREKELGRRDLRESDCDLEHGFLELTPEQVLLLVPQTSNVAMTVFPFSNYVTIGDRSDFLDLIKTSRNQKSELVI